MSEFITIGESLVVFCSTEPDVTIQDSTNFNKVVGGAELNVAVGVRRLGHSVEYIGQVGKDPQGKFIEKQIKSKSIGTKYLEQTDQYLNGYQMKQLVTKGDPKVFNFRKNSAGTNIDLDLINKIDLSGVKIGHVTGIFPATSKNALATSMALIKRLNQNEITVTFDPNLRPDLWPNQETMVRTLNEIASLADIVLPGQSEGKILTGYDDPEKIADFYLQGKTKAVFVKVGSKGAYVKTKTSPGVFVPGFKVEKVVDTVGAGDGFALGVITSLLEGKTYAQAAKRGNAVGALQVQAHGDNDGYPTRNELDEFYQENGVENI